MRDILVKVGMAASSVILCFAAFGTGDAKAATIRSPISATASSEHSNAYDIGNTIDQSGLNIGFNSGVDDFDAYLAQNPMHVITAPDNEWFTPLRVKSATVDYDLGEIFTVDRLALWNEEVSGIKAFRLFASLDGVNFSRISGKLLPVDNPRFFDYSAEVFNLGSVNARYIRFDIRRCPQRPSVYNGCGIGEVAFSTSPVSRGNGDEEEIPTPALLPGLVGMGLAALRKRKQTAEENS